MLKKGMKVNRNSDRAFEKILSQDNSAARKISVNVRIKDCDGGITIEAECEDGVKAQTSITGDFEPARNAQMALDNLKANISKTGDTIYEVIGVDIDIDEPKFIPNSIIAEIRRDLTNALDDARTASHKRDTRRAEEPGCTYPYAKIGYDGNVNNQLAKAFLEEHGATDVEDSFELKARKNVPLMTCRHCIKRIAGLCAKNGYQADYSLKHHIKAAAQEPLYIHNDTGTRLRLEFDCKKCEMTIYKD
jgi:putative protease